MPDPNRSSRKMWPQTPKGDRFAGGTALLSRSQQLDENLAKSPSLASLTI